jgi:tRNA1Val (adenine37-N6)-methyltransferase
MNREVFHFKQFSVAHDLCAQKVGTDGVLLGAWTNIPGEAKNILDVGTGSGLIALMLAQRSDAAIDAIDIDENAFRQAQANFNNSRWNERMKTFCVRLENFVSEKKYDLIVCNPPFFQKSMKPAKKGRSVARHDDSLGFDELIFHSKRLLKEDGWLSVIIPYSRDKDFSSFAEKNQFCLTRKTKVRGSAASEYKRVLMELKNGVARQEKIIENELIIETSRNQFTDRYRELTKDFYLKF